MLIKGITKLSELNIDADKDWNTKGITNIKQVAASMSIGDLIQHDGTKLITFAAGPTGYVVTSQGAGKLCVWAPAGGALKYYFPVSIVSSVTVAIVVISQFIAKNAAIGTSYKYAYNDDPADYIKQLTPALASVNTSTIIVAPDQSIAKNASVGSDLSILVDGFVEETAAAAQTDHTAEARSGAAGDLNLCPMTGALNDKIYIGSTFPFYRAWMNYSQAGAGNWTNACYYWNGAWTLCVDEIDATSSFLAAAGIKKIQHTPQGDWALSVILGMNLYWMMIRTDNFVNQATKPLGSQIFVSIR